MRDSAQHRVLESLQFYAGTLARLPTLGATELCQTIADTAGGVLRREIVLVALRTDRDDSIAVLGQRGLSNNAREHLGSADELIAWLWREAKGPMKLSLSGLEPALSEMADRLGLGDSVLAAPVYVVSDYQEQQVALLVTARPRGGRHQIDPDTALMTLDVLAGLAAGGIASLLGREQLKRAEVQKAAAVMAAKVRSQFLANMSHEIRTPMNAVLGMTELLLRTELTDTQSRYANIVYTAGKNLLDIINDILDFSKIDVGKLHLHNTDFSLHDTVEEVATLLARDAQAKGLEVACMVHADVPNTVRGDPVRLRQVLTNLTANAVKFTETGEVVLRVVPCDSGASYRVRFEISDTGIGIGADELENIFEPFAQADGSDTRRYEGTGLGLAIAAQLVEMMDGKIGVESAPSKGSTFWFTARLAAPEGAAAAPLRPAQSMVGLRVLIVDDNQTNRQILSEYLRSWNMTCEAAVDGTKGIELLRTAAGRGKPFELVVLDMQMPGLTGLDLARLIQADPALVGTPMILLSSVDMIDPGDLARSGIHWHLTKPVRQSELFDCVARAVGGAGGLGAPAHEPVTRAPARVAMPSGAEECRCPLVLVAEDNPVNQEVIVGLLGELGIDSHVVSSGREAVDVLEQSCYAAILMDCKMPEMDGYEATAEIRRREGDGAHTPIIGLSAHALAGDSERAIKAGMDDYLTKPVELEQLQAALTRAFGEITGGPQPAPVPAVQAPTLDGSRTSTPRAVAVFLRHLGDQVAALSTSSAAGPDDAVVSAAHRLRGSCLDVGAQRLAALCQHLEDPQVATDSARVAALVSEIESEAERVRLLLPNVSSSAD